LNLLKYSNGKDDDEEEDPEKKKMLEKLSGLFILLIFKKFYLSQKMSTKSF
jgi:hypothetical protein